MNKRLGRILSIALIVLFAGWTIWEEMQRHHDVEEQLKPISQQTAAPR